MNKSKYTFLLPAYKARFFEEALLSIKNQSYKDFVCIVSDDCSPEDLKSVFDRVCAEDSRFSYRRNEKNIGGENLVKHWNMLVDMCETEYLIMASDDDVYHARYLEEIDILTRNYPDVNVFRARLQRINSKGEVLIRGLRADEYLDQLQYIWFLFTDIQSLQNYCYKQTALKASGGFVDYPAAWFSDDATNISLAENGCASTDQILFDFRSSDLNVSSVENEAVVEKKINGLMQFHHWFFPIFTDIVANQPCAEIQLSNMVRSKVICYVKSMAQDFILCLGWRKALRYIHIFSSLGILGRNNTLYKYVRFKLTGSRP